MCNFKTTKPCLISHQSTRQSFSDAICWKFVCNAPITGKINLIISLPLSLVHATVSFGYILNGFYVGWSSKFFSFEEESMDSHYVSFVIQFKIKPFHDIDVWWQFDFSYHLSKTASSISNIVDHFGVPSRSRDCIDIALQILLFLWN